MDTGELSGKPKSLHVIAIGTGISLSLMGPLARVPDFTLDLFNSSPFFSILDHFHPFGYFLYSRAKAF